jgi:sugar phosphate isomerase/epimerase
MKIGFPNYPRSDVIEEIEWIGRNKFDFIDLFLEEDKAVPKKIDIEKIKNSLLKYKLDVIGHTACYLPIGSPMKSLRIAAIEEIERYLKTFYNIGVEMVTIHANWPNSMFSSNEGIDFQVETLKILIKKAEKHDIKLIYEPTDTQKDNTKNISKILKRVPNLLLHLDIGHANLYNRKPDLYIKRFNKRIRHVHLNDNTRNMDLHLPLGCGNINWYKTIKILKQHYDGTITLEIFSRDRDYALLSKKKFRELWNKL